LKKAGYIVQLLFLISVPLLR